MARLFTVPFLNPACTIFAVKFMSPEHRRGKTQTLSYIGAGTAGRGICPFPWMATLGGGNTSCHSFLGQVSGHYWHICREGSCREVCPRSLIVILAYTLGRQILPSGCGGPQQLPIIRQGSQKSHGI